jgi:hypothetical protein
MPPTSEDFSNELNLRFRTATYEGVDHLIVISGELHRKVGGYPTPYNRMPICCDVMLNAMNLGDEILRQPPKGKGATLEIRYLIPRK